MKHILRKLHIGGSHESLDERNETLRVNPGDTMPPQEPGVPSTSSGLSGWLTNARHSRLPSSNSNTPRSRLASADNPALDSPGSEAPSFTDYEEEYQVQLALALSVSSENMVDDDDPELLQIRAAKRISLGRPPLPASRPAECAAHRYWTYNVLDYEEKVVDGFYDVIGVVSDFGTAEKMPSLVDLQGTPVTDMLGYEVILVNRGIDPDLVHLEQVALCLAVDCGMSGISTQSSDLIQKITDLVVQQMGGPVVDANEMLRSWRARSHELQTSLNSIVLPLGCLKIGLSRHRALLFKVLADHVGILCRLVKGSHYTGTDEGAVNIVKLDSEREFIVDLMGAPGTLLPAEMGGATGNIDLFENTALVEELFSQIEKAQKSLANGMVNRKESGSSAACPQDNGPGQEIQSASSNTQFAYEIEDIMAKQKLPCLSVMGSESCVPSEELHSSNPFFDTKMVRDHHSLAPCHTPGMASKATLQDTQVSFRSNEDDGACSRLSPLHGSTMEDCSEHEIEMQMKRINQRVDSGYMECWTENVKEWEISWEEIVIWERIGLGSYGEVHRGEWHGKEVAVKKFLDQDFFGDALDEFISEVRIMRRMQHPNVVLFLGAVTRPPNLSIMTEYLPRGSLFRLLHRPNCQLDEKLRLKMALDVAEGMNYLHTSMPIIVHRDLKSPNLLVDKDWVIKVCDFGLSRLKHHTFLSSKSTAGTPEWMAPEVLRNEPSNEKCDVYSFGVILWELSTLQQPWIGMNPMQVVGAVGFQNRHLELPRNLEPSVARIIMGCWQSNPRLRPSFSEILVALKPLERLLKD